MTIVEAAAKLCPGTAWNCFENIETGEITLVQADDGAKRVSVPTMDEIQKCIYGDPLAYRELRVKEYPSLADQLDAIWKGGDDLEAMRAVVLAVKEKYPKIEQVAAAPKVKKKTEVVKKKRPKSK